jgi:ketosteroid isomerase-like protein
MDPDAFERVDDAALPPGVPRVPGRAFGGGVAVIDQSERNKTLVLEYMQAFRTFDPEKYFPYLAENPTYMAGMNIRKGREAFQANTDAGKLLYPKPAAATNEHLAVLADGNWVAVLLIRRAETNKVKDYENIYGMFYEVLDGKIHTQVELMDFRVSNEKFDLSVLGR